MRTPFACVGALALFAAASCLTVGDESSRGEPAATEVDREAPPATRDAVGDLYYRVTRPDERDCIYPLCGGVFVQAVNATQTSCLDGTVAEDCYVADIDLALLGLDNAVLAELSEAADAGQALVRGRFQKLVSQHGEAAVLVATEGWLPQAHTKPASTFYRVSHSGIVCITWPCPDLNEVELNALEGQPLHGLDLGQTGASPEAVEQAMAAVYAGGILVAGTHETITGPGGEGTRLVASEFYSLAGVAPTEGEPCGQGVCEVGEFCCNASCGICAPLGGACIELACAPCGHSVCEQGEKLKPGCDECVRTVCEQDAYCCETAWDSICVGEAAELCGGCVDSPPEPDPPSCAHSECEPGAALDAGCSS